VTLARSASGGADAAGQTQADAGFVRGRWIWTEAPGPNQYVVFANTVALPPQPGPIRVRIAASSFYDLYLNGAYLGRGPVAGDPHWCLYDELIFTPAPAARQLHIAIVAHYSRGTRILALLPAPGGIIAELSGQDLQLGTDASWKCLPLAMWRQDVAERGWALDYCEDYDAVQEPPGWEQHIFPPETTATWPAATEVAPAKAIWSGYEARPVPYLVQRFVAPLAFSAYQAPGAGAARVEDVSRYCDEEPLESHIQDAPFDLASINRHVLTSNAFTFDLGREYIGHYELELDAPAGVVIELSGAELLRDGRPWIFRKNVCYSARYRTRAGRQRLRSFSWSGFRYLHLVVRGASSKVRIQRIGCQERTVPLQLTQGFHTPDPVLQQIFDLCRRTLEISVREHLIDCPTREQAQYWGDAVFIAQSLWVGFGEPAYLRWLLECFLHVPFNTAGQISCVYPGEHQTLLDYSLVPLLGQRFYHEHTGSFYRVHESSQKALRLKAWYDARCDAQGLVQAAAIETIGGVTLVNFIDHPGLGWHDFPHPGIDRDGVSCPLNIFYYGFLHILVTMLAALDPAHSEVVRQQAVALKATIKERFFDGTVFHDARRGDQLSEGTSWQTNALAVYFDLIQGEQAQTALWTMLERYDTVCRCSPYFYFYLLPALRKAGLEHEAGALIKREWQPMLEGGATTTWEGFAGDAKDSLCHPWSTAPFLHLMTSEQEDTIAAGEPIPCG
jgi:hypothetical protein